MKRTLALLLPLALVACQDATESPLAPTQDAVNIGSADLNRMSLGSSPDQVVPGEIIVKFKQGVEPAAAARGHGLALGRMGFQDRFSVVKVARGNERAEAARLAASANVEYAEPNYLRQPTGCSSRQWAFYNPGGCTIIFQNDPNGRDGQTVTSYVSTADADEDASGSDVPAGYGSGGATVVVGSLDTGVDFGHQEFAGGQLIAGKDWVNNDNDPSDDDGHGTHTTGTMAGSTVGVAGATGAGSNVRVYVQKVCGPSGCPTSAIVNAIYAAADYPGLVAMNLSLGGTRESKSEKDAINYAVNSKGVLVIASAGNDGSGRVACPACDPNAISVAATNWQDGLTYYSQYGSGLDISAPGGEMYSNTTEESGIYSSIPGGYAFYQGTSMAAPQVTGTAGVVASKTGLRGSGLRQRIESTADDLGASGYDTTFGNGRVNTYAAVTTSGGGGGGGSEPPPDTCVPKGKGNNYK
ncbi:S8 family peptidase [soil metagenome]